MRSGVPLAPGGGRKDPRFRPSRPLTSGTAPGSMPRHAGVVDDPRDEREDQSGVFIDLVLRGAGAEMIDGSCGTQLAHDGERERPHGGHYCAAGTTMLGATGASTAGATSRAGPSTTGSGAGRA